MLIVALIVLGIALDQVSKHIILVKLHPQESIPLIKNIFHLTLVFNSGSAFGILKGYTALLIFISLISALLILRQLSKNIKTKGLDLFMLSLCFILSGTLGNLIDRIRFGFVVDFLDFRFWPVFNIADSLICIGGFLLFISFLRGKCTL